VLPIVPVVDVRVVLDPGTCEPLWFAEGMSPGPRAVGRSGFFSLFMHPARPEQTISPAPIACHSLRFPCAMIDPSPGLGGAPGPAGLRAHRPGGPRRTRSRLRGGDSEAGIPNQADSW
jgi:hypothetical protein